MLQLASFLPVVLGISRFLLVLWHLYCSCNNGLTGNHDRASIDDVTFAACINYENPFAEHVFSLFSTNQENAGNSEVCPLTVKQNLT